MDRFVSEVLWPAVFPDSHPYCIPVGTPICFFIPRTIPRETALRILASRGYQDDTGTEAPPNPTNIPCFGHLYHPYPTWAYNADVQALGEELSRVPGAALERLGRCVGYDGDLMPHLSPAPPVDPGLAARLESGGYDGDMGSLMVALGGQGSVWAALRAYGYYFDGRISSSPSYGSPLYGGVTGEVLAPLLRAKWVSWEGQGETISGVYKGAGPESVTRYQNLMFAVPAFAAAALVRSLSDTPYAFAVASAWPLHYGLEEWRVRDAYLTGRTDPACHFASAESLGSAAAWNYLFGRSRPGPEFLSLYVTVCVHATRPAPSLLVDIARIASDLHDRDRAWHDERQP